ncbi:MAG: lactonase family protein [Sphingobacteriia bacterium]|nr:MAG: lactonase family protein [Sphingobacteriia bacterium]
MKKYTITVLVLLFNTALFCQPSYKMIIGTYTHSGNSEGIYTFQFNTKDGSALPLGKQATPNPSFLISSINQQIIYSVNEQANTGTVTAFKLNTKADSLTQLNTVATGGDHPCYLASDRNNRFLFVSNYTGGSFSAIPLKADGILDTSIQTIQHIGKSIIIGRQESPHVHSTVLSPNEKYLLVQDLGTDKISVYQVDLNKIINPIDSSPIHIFNCKPGSGPRHLIFHPTYKLAYAVQELSGAVTVMSFKNGRLKQIQEISMIPTSSKGKAGAADIHISPDGAFLYASNRGDFNELAIYKINKNGTLSHIATQSTLGKTPRNFAIDPSGKFLLIANQNSNEIVVFDRNKTTGLISHNGQRIKVGSPICIQFLKN